VREPRGGGLGCVSVVFIETRGHPNLPKRRVILANWETSVSVR